jgi:hypothetical protein
MGMEFALILVKNFLNSMYNNNVDGLENGIINCDLAL